MQALTVDNCPLVTASFYMDKISHLSDDLLLRILSLNTAKDVMATSLLSKRWRSLWTLVPGIKYDDSNHNVNYKLFTHFLIRRLFQSNKGPVLEHLHLSLGPDCSSVDIGVWINLAVAHHLRELHIHIHSSKKGSVSLPSSLYTSETLQSLTLIKFVFLDVPVHVHLPSLKTLSLESVTYANKTSLQRLLSGCPNLGVLSVEHRSEDPPMDVNVVVPSLQRLYVRRTRGTYVLNVPSLKYLKCTGMESSKLLQIENMPELVRAHVTLCIDAHKSLKALTSARRLKLWIILPVVVNPWGMIFNQLVHLTMCRFAGRSWDLVTCMLQNSPNLRFLKLIDDKLYMYLCGMDITAVWKRPSSVPECLLHSLEVFEWSGYRGIKGEREMATYVLKNATCLKTATFSPLSTDLGEKYQMLKELASVGTASASCQLLFD